MSPGGRRLIEETFGIPVISKYSAMESLKVGFVCEARSGFHLHEDLYHLTVVDREGRQLPDGRARRDPAFEPRQPWQRPPQLSNRRPGQDLDVDVRLRPEHARARGPRGKDERVHGAARRVARRALQGHHGPQRHPWSRALPARAGLTDGVRATPGDRRSEGVRRRGPEAARTAAANPSRLRGQAGVRRGVADRGRARSTGRSSSCRQTSISSASPWPPPEQMAARPSPPPGGAARR